MRSVTKRGTCIQYSVVYLHLSALKQRTSVVNTDEAIINNSLLSALKQRTSVVNTTDEA